MANRAKTSRPHATITGHRAYGDAVVARARAADFPKDLRGAVRDFAAVHARFETSSVTAENARAARDAALHAVALADAALDARVLVLADTMVAARLGTRIKPFAAFSKHSPSALTDLAYADEVREVLALVAKLSSTKDRSVAAARRECEKAAAVVKKALGELTAPQSAYTKALGARDELLLGWTKALKKLERRAAVTFEDHPAALRALLAAPDGVQVRTRRREPKKASATAPAAPTAPRS